MLKFDSKTNTYEIPMPIRSDYFNIITVKDKVSCKHVLITYLTEEEERKIDAGLTISIVRGNAKFRISKRDVYFYGVMDFNQGSDDFTIIDNSPILDDLGLQGKCIPSDYDFANHTCYSPIKYYRYYESWSPAFVFQYYYAMLGKPERALIFRIKKI